MYRTTRLKFLLALLKQDHKKWSSHGMAGVTVEVLSLKMDLSRRTIKAMLRELKAGHFVKCIGDGMWTIKHTEKQHGQAY